MGQSATSTVKAAARRHSPAFFLLALILLISAPALSAVGSALAAGDGARFVAPRTAALGTIVVDSQPTSADVRLDGLDAGLSTPVTSSGVAPGAHQVSVTIPGFQPWQQTVTVAAGATTTVQAALLVALPATVSAEVTVTTASDALDADASSIAALKADPGADGGISLREAITAVNATAGVKVIRFAAALKGAVITPGQVTRQPLPILTGGDIWIVGDIDGDGAPDVTLDGAIGQVTHDALINGISIWSNGDVVSGLRFVNYRGGPVMLCPPFDWPGPTKTLADDQVLGNSLVGNGAGVGPLGWVAAEDPVPISNLTWSGLVFAGNQIGGGGIAATPGEGTAHDNRIADLTIASNVVTGDGFIAVIASDTNSAWQGVPGPTRYADHNTVQGVTIEHNRCRESVYRGIVVFAGNMGNSDNAVSDVVIRDNDISFAPPWGRGIDVSAGAIAYDSGERASARDSLTHVEIRGNRVQGGQVGIVVSAASGGAPSQASQPAAGAADDIASDIVVADNEIRNTSEFGILATAGLSNAGPEPCRDTTLSGLLISGNLLANAKPGGVGIRLAGGISYPEGGPVTGNEVSGASLTDNTVRGFAQGIWISGGDGAGAVGNTLAGSSSSNSVAASQPWLLTANDVGATGNTLSFAAAELVPTITKVTPAVGRVGTVVTLTGSGFGSKRGAGLVEFGGTTCTKYVLWSDAQIKCRVPAKAKPGVVKVTVTTAGGSSDAVSFKVGR